MAIHNQNEFLLSYLAGLWLLQFFSDNIRMKSSTKIFKKLRDLRNQYPQSDSLWEFLDAVFSNLNENKILDSLLLVKIPDLHDSLVKDTLGTLLQQILTSDDRKRLAANYTTKNSANLLIKILDTDVHTSIIDPFCGSGRLISAYLEELSPRSQFPRIRIHDLMPSAVLIAYCRLILILSENNQDLSLLYATIGDAFATFSLEDDSKDLGKYDLVLMNPPFTRTHRIDKNQRRKLLAIEQHYSQYLSGQVGLHIYAILLADLLMNENGVLGAVLPAATVLSQYSRGVHKFFLNNYQVKTIASSEDEKAYSEDSNLREIILIAKKNEEKEEKIQFLQIDSHEKFRWQISSTQMVPKETLAKEWNWTIFLRDIELLKIRNLLLQSGFIKSGNELDLNIVRGVEMYGPDFFFVPNRKWQIASETEEELTLKNDKNTIRVPKKFLVRSLRKPGNYNQYISPKVSDFALSVPNSDTVSQQWMKDYLLISEQFASPAKRKFKEEWISHIHNQVKIKKPWGHLFFIDKFGISSTSVMGHFIETKLICSKNFYVLRNCTARQAKLYTAWLNSAFFIALFLLTRREIGGSYGRLQIVDYMKEPLFLDFSKFSNSVKNQIIKQFDKYRSLKLPPIPDQLQFPQRKALDHSVIKGLKLPKKIEESLLIDIYALLERIFKNLKRRDNTQRVKKQGY